MKTIDVRYYQKQIYFTLWMFVTCLIALTVVLINPPFSWWTTGICLITSIIQLLELLRLVMKQRWETNRAFHYYE